MAETTASKSFTWTAKFLIVAALMASIAVSSEFKDEDAEKIIDKPISTVMSRRSTFPQWDDIEILESIEERPRNKRRIGDKKKKFRDNKESDSPSDNTAAEVADKDDENYHVRYSTKFAFQNIDEFGLKVKYNKTENVFYGDNILPESQSQIPMVEPMAKPGQPAALTFISANDVDKEHGSIIQLQSIVPSQESHQEHDNSHMEQPHRGGKLSVPTIFKKPGDDILARRTMGEGGESWAKFLGRVAEPPNTRGIMGGGQRQRGGQRQKGGQRSMGGPSLLAAMGGQRSMGGFNLMGGPRSMGGKRPMGQRSMDDYGDDDDDYESGEAPDFGSMFRSGGHGGHGGKGGHGGHGKASRELSECRHMEFAEDMNVQDMRGICLLCVRNQDEYGRILHSVQGCPAIDCEEFELPNPYDKYPYCCPTCKGARHPHKEYDLELAKRAAEEAEMAAQAESEESKEEDGEGEGGEEPEGEGGTDVTGEGGETGETTLGEGESGGPDDASSADDNVDTTSEEPENPEARRMFGTVKAPAGRRAMNSQQGRGLKPTPAWQPKRRVQKAGQPAGVKPAGAKPAARKRVAPKQ